MPSYTMAEYFFPNLMPCVCVVLCMQCVVYMCSMICIVVVR